MPRSSAKSRRERRVIGAGPAAQRARWPLLVLPALWGTAACQGAGSSPLIGAGGATNDEEFALSETQLSKLRSLRYDSGPPPRDVSNRFADDPRAQRLGHRLFFDTSLSGPLLEGDNTGEPGTLGVRGEPGKVSCASCHVPEDHFVDTRSPHGQISLAALWTQRRSPTLLEVGFAPLYNWDGRRDSLWAQAIGVMESEREFNSSRLFIAQRVLAAYRAEYEALFGGAPSLNAGAGYPELTPLETGCTQLLSIAGVSYECRGKPGDGGPYDQLDPSQQTAVTQVTVNAAKAIAAYVRQLRCGESRFDRWLDGEVAALSPSEVRGAALFVGKGQCVDCHSGPNLTDGRFHNVGLRPGIVAVAFTDTDDRGAGEAIPALLADPLNSAGRFSDGDRAVIPAVEPALEGAFRTPTLRCAADQPSFLHTGQYKTLEGVVAFFARGGDPPGGYPGKNELEALELSADDEADLVAFLRALGGPGPEASLLGPPDP